MSPNYKFHNPEGLYFVSIAVIEWIDVFTRACIKEKGMELFAWCIMTNHIHLIFRSVNG
jgi:REP element-mobilizing transposase RayT